MTISIVYNTAVVKGGNVTGKQITTTTNTPVYQPFVQDHPG